ncbi:hypothetical protein, partial [Bremerella sp. JC817]|uniref:hypothetical protein n=1 Tax=Bremerella sp. JC817 TaxID=3231756 RepID=UPI003459C8C0
MLVFRIRVPRDMLASTFERPDVLFQDPYRHEGPVATEIAGRARGVVIPSEPWIGAASCCGIGQDIHRIMS